MGPFGMSDPNSLPAMRSRMMPPGMIPGPVAPVQVQSGFRPPGAGGGPGLPSQPGMQQMGGMPSMDPAAMALLAGMMNGGNERQVNRTLDAAPPGGNSDPMAQGAAQAADMQRGSFGSWLRGLF